MFEVLKDSELLVLDFDGVFYSFTKEFEDHCDDMVVAAVMKLGLPLPEEEVRRIAVESYKKYGASFYMFNQDFNMKIEDFHHAYHDALQDAYIETAHITAEHIKKCPMPVALLSHSNRKWITGMLAKFELDKVIAPDRIFALEDVGFHYKSHGQEPFRHVVGKMGARADRAIMVEDTVHNLKAAKQCGMHTVLVKNGRSFERADHPQVDVMVENLPEFLAGIS